MLPMLAAFAGFTVAFGVGLAGWVAALRLGVDRPNVRIRRRWLIFAGWGIVVVLAAAPFELVGAPRLILAATLLPLILGGAFAAGLVR